MASAEIGHDALVDLASEETFQAPDDLSLGSAVRRAACDVINGRLMVPHAVLVPEGPPDDIRARIPLTFQLTTRIRSASEWSVIVATGRLRSAHRWSAVIRCQNTGDGVRFRASH